MILACRDRKKRGAGVIVITRISLVFLSCVIVLGLASAGLAQAQDVMVTRSINPDSVPAGGGVVTVTIGITGAYGIGSVVEKVPADFTYVEGSVTPSDITVVSAGQNVTFSLLGEPSFSYRVNTSISAGEHRFPSGSQLTYGVDKDVAPVSGESMVTVEQAQQPSVSVTRAISPDSVPAGGGEVTVTIRINGAYGIGSVVEKLPADFSYVPGSVTPSDITTEIAGQNVTFSLVGESSFSYRVNTSSSSGDHRFPSGSQLTYGVDKDTAPVVGESSVTVEQAQQPSVSVTRAISPDSVPAGGGVVTVTISINGNYGIGSVVEKLPADFSYLPGSVTPSDITTEIAGQNVTFSLVGESSFRYRVNTSSSSGDHRFPAGSQLTYGVDKDTAPVSGDARVRVGGPPAPRPTPANNPPAFSDDAVTRSVDENAPPGTNAGDPVTATDPDGDTPTYALSGTDTSSFTIDNTGQITVGSGTTLDYETKETYMVTVTATDRQDATDTIDVTIMVTDVDERPAFDEDATTRTVEENSAGGTNVGDPVMATDADAGDTLTYALSGDDAMYFDIGESTGQITVGADAMLDYEMPRGMAMSDTNTNDYMVTVTAIDSSMATDTIDVTIMVTAAVTAGDPVVIKYDTNPTNGTIEKSEVIAAINDYFEEGADAPSKADVIKLINLYFGG